MELLADRGVDATWRRSIAEALAVIELLDGRIAALERELRQAARDDQRVVLLKTIPGVGDLLGLTLASEIGDVARFATARKLIGYAGLAPRVHQSGERSHTGALSKAGSRTLRWAAVEAAHAAWRPTNPWHELYSEIAKRTGKKPAKSAAARKILIACWHILSRRNPSSRPLADERGHRCLGKLPLLSGRLTAPHGIEKPRQLPRTICAPSAKKRNEPPTPPHREHPPKSTTRWTASPPSKRKGKSACGHRRALRRPRCRRYVTLGSNVSVIVPSPECQRSDEIRCSRSHAPFFRSNATA